VAAIRVYKVAVFRCFGWPFSIARPGRFDVFRAIIEESLLYMKSMKEKIQA
jgi:hypothetical protein